MDILPKKAFLLMELSLLMADLFLFKDLYNEINHTITPATNKTKLIINRIKRKRVEK